MSDRTVDDGLGGEIQAGAALDEPPEGYDGEEPIGFPYTDTASDQGEAGASAEEASPWGELDSRFERVVRNKGWKSPSDAVRDYAELESEVGRLRQRMQSLGSERERALEDEIAALRQEIQQLRQPEPMASDPELEVVDFGQLLNEQDWTEGNALNYLAYQLVPAMIKGYVDRSLRQFREQELVPLREYELRPLQQVMSTAQLRDQAERLLNIYPNDFQDLMGRTEEIYRSTKALHNLPDGLEIAMARAKIERDARLAAQGRRDAAAAGDLGGGTRGPAPEPEPDAGLALRAALKRVGGTRNDGLS